MVCVLAAADLGRTKLSDSNWGQYADPRNTTSISILLVVRCGCYLEDREEGFLGNVHAADAFHAPLAFFLFFEEFALARDVAAIALGENVLAHGRDRFARVDAAADGRLDGHFEIGRAHV